MSKFLEYKGYLGSVEVDLDELFVFGRLMFIRDVVSYRADVLGNIGTAFEEAVDDYLTTCQQLGDAPELPCKGTFNVRVGPSLHQRVAIDCSTEEISLNEWVKQACELKLACSDSASTDSSTMRPGTLLEVKFEEEQVFEFGGNLDWQTQNNRRTH
ncbi:type II toxin-antitoxin system HicB family antitoxin [Polaromonas eurypsychrophila]|uniref:Type II toxin-antitoxin system HicB family antitoxin n=1 Tax=Polaromonas eurypsychrophila TaxID=1614635 RepID=A0A916SGX5_9BURK|nr:type II toxin-antitoxin system HicB family antitoxin [Polaromonas eurypsychrophila]GGA99666.1 hypothetical protein GCM10011496_20900 [Polaromonas eurypsychrophila]